MTSTDETQRSAVVTGAGSGLGRDIALGLAAKNYRVFGTALSPGEIQDLRSASGGSVTLAQCDITDEAAVKAWADEVTQQNDGRIDLLISNAGILTPGPLEVLPLGAIRHEFEVNVFGAVAVVNSFLPGLRKARGRIVQVSTMTATLPFPFNGPSGASKAAFDALAAVYRAELKPFGGDVVLAVAGNMRTGGPAKTAAALQRTGSDDTRAAGVVRRVFQYLRYETERYAGRRSRFGLGRQPGHRAVGTSTGAEPSAGRHGRRGDHAVRQGEVRCRAGRDAPTDGRIGVVGARC